MLTFTTLSDSEELLLLLVLESELEPELEPESRFKVEEAVSLAVPVTAEALVPAPSDTRPADGDGLDKRLIKADGIFVADCAAASFPPPVAAVNFDTAFLGVKDTFCSLTRP